MDGRLSAAVRILTNSNSGGLLPLTQHMPSWDGQSMWVMEEAPRELLSTLGGTHSGYGLSGLSSITVLYGGY